MSIRHWTEEETQILVENYGQVTMKILLTKLDRSEVAIQNKVARLKLGRWFHNLDDPTLSEFSKYTNISYATLLRWSELYGLPLKKRRLKDFYIKIINLNDFWRWAEKNKNMIEWDKVEKYCLGAEPNWVQIARNAAIKSKDKSMKKIEWSKDEDEKLLWMLKQHRFTYPQIAKELGRTHGAIKRRMQHLKTKLRPVYLDNKRKYTQEEVDLILDMYQKGNSFRIIAEKLDRSEAGVRGKLERMGYKFENRVLKKEGED